MAKKIGRPKFIIDYELVASLAEIHCTQAEIAAILGCAVRTLQNDAEFMRVYQKGIETGKKSLRRLQWAAAHKGNTTMLIWLGKQYLGQRDTPAEVNDTREAKGALVAFMEQVTVNAAAST